MYNVSSNLQALLNEIIKVFNFTYSTMDNIIIFGNFSLFDFIIAITILGTLISFVIARSTSDVSYSVNSYNDRVSKNGNFNFSHSLHNKMKLESNSRRKGR